jgi:hypothetical protein
MFGVLGEVKVLSGWLGTATLGMVIFRSASMSCAVLPPDANRDLVCAIR